MTWLNFLDTQATDLRLRSGAFIVQRHIQWVRQPGSCFHTAPAVAPRIAPESSTLPALTKVLVRRWGRIGTRRPRSIQMVIAGPDELERWVDLIARRREHHGYQTRREIRAPAIEASAA